MQADVLWNDLRLMNDRPFGPVVTVVFFVYKAPTAVF